MKKSKDINILLCKKKRKVKKERIQNERKL